MKWSPTHRLEISPNLTVGIYYFAITDLFADLLPLPHKLVKHCGLRIHFRARDKPKI